MSPFKTFAVAILVLTMIISTLAISLERNEDIESGSRSLCNTFGGCGARSISMAEVIGGDSKLNLAPPYSKHFSRSANHRFRSNPHHSRRNLLRPPANLPQSRSDAVRANRYVGDQTMLDNIELGSTGRHHFPSGLTA